MKIIRDGGELLTPIPHGPSHSAEGLDPLKLDDLAAPTDVTKLNATQTAHGLMPKLPASDGKTYGIKDGAYAEMTATGGGSDEWRLAITMNVLMMAQISASRLGFADGWIDSLTDTMGLNVANSTGVVSGGAASATVASIVTPTMTSNTAPSGVCSASTGFGDPYLPWKAFNRTNADSGDSWLTSTVPALGTPGSWQWLKYAFPVGQSARAATYSVISRNYGDQTHPKTFILQGSADDSAWTDLNSQSGLTWASNETKTFTIASPDSYRYYRMLIKECTGPTYLAVGELQLKSEAASVVLESVSATVSAGDEYLVVLLVNTNKNFTVEIDAGAGWETVTMDRTVCSATADQLSGTITRAGGSAVKVKVTAADNTGVVYGWGCFWR